MRFADSYDIDALKAHLRWMDSIFVYINACNPDLLAEAIDFANEVERIDGEQDDLG